MKKCLLCFNEFSSNVKNQKYCSEKCYKSAKYKRFSDKRWINLLETKPYNIVCKVCKNEFRSPKPEYTCYSKECRNKATSIAQKKFLDIPSCIEGASRKLDKKLGYVRLYVPMHPEANTWGYVYEHRIIAEQMVGRRLLSNEIVHHKNGKRWDNRPENLEVMDKSEHSKLGGQREEDKHI